MNDNKKFYDGTKLMSLQDLNGNKPELYISTTNRSAGKTTFFNRYFVKRFIEKGEMFMLLYRFKYELSDVPDKFFTDIKKLFFRDYNMTAKLRGKGLYAELFINDKLCGYAVSVNTADSLKKYSHLFSNVTRMLFDEFQLENLYGYCPNEVKKFISIHTSVSRGNGEQSRYVPVYMLSNKVSLLNPYYTELGITERLTPNTVYLKGDGFVLEQSFNASASEAQKGSSFLRAFSNSDYVEYSSGKDYLYSDTAFVEKMTGKSKYICTFRYQGCDYSVREFYDNGIVYCDTNVDISYPVKLAVSTSDHNVSYVLNNATNLIVALRMYFEKGMIRFKNQTCKQALIALIKL